MTGFNRRLLKWQPAHRIVPTRFPSIYLYDRVANQEDFEALNLLEAMTNPRIRDENGEICLVPKQERLFGPGTGPIMASFTHLNPAGSRFSDGTYGVFYAAKERVTAIAETRFHSENFLRATNENPLHLQMRLYHVQVKGEVVELVTDNDANKDIFSLTSYSASQAFGQQMREQGVNGVSYASVREPGGHCVAVFKTAIVNACVHAAYLEYHWNGVEINYITERL